MNDVQKSLTLWLVIIFLAACHGEEVAATGDSVIHRPAKIVAETLPTIDPKIPEGRILQKWHDLGGIDVVGEAIEAFQEIEFPSLSENPEVSDVKLSYQKFDRGVIVYSADYGAVYLSHAVFERWQLIWESNPTNFWLTGHPIADNVVHGDIEEAAFQNAMIVVEGGTPTLIHPLAYGRYVDLMDVLGRPRSELILLEETNDGELKRAYQQFEHGDIYWDISLGAHALWGRLWQYWKESAGSIESAIARWGFPTSNVTDIIGGDAGGELDTMEPKTIGQSLRLENAVFYTAANADNGDVYEVTGGIQEAYDKEGGASGWLGFPIAARKINQQGKGYQEFENGVLIQPTLGIENAIPFQSARFMLQHIRSKGEDCILGICGGLDLKVEAKVSASSAKIGEMEYDPFQKTNNNGEMSPDWLVPEAEDWPVSGDLVVQVTVQAWDIDDLSNNDFLGKVEHTYSVDNFWGFGEPEEYTAAGENSNLKIAVLMAMKTTQPFDSSDFRGNMFWSFRNFSTPDDEDDKVYKMPKPSYDVFARAFEDVDPDEAVWRHPFNWLFYEISSDLISASGNCLGMCLESIYAQRGQSIYAQPIFRYFPDTSDGIRPFEAYQNGQPQETHKILMRQMNVRQYAQLSQDAIIWTAIKALSADPLSTFEDTFLLNEIGIPSVLNIYQGNFNSAHAVRPYKWEKDQKCSDNDDSECHFIYIADPNCPKGRSDQFKNCEPDLEQVIKIDKNTNTYKHLGDDDYDEGGIFHMPFSLLDFPQKTPYNLVGTALLLWPLVDPLVDFGMSLGTGIGPESGTVLFSTFATIGLFVLIIGSDAEVNQVTDEQGRTLFEEGLTTPPTEWGHLRQDKARRIPHTAPIPLIGNDSDVNSAKIFAGYRSGSTHTYEIVPAADVVAHAPMEMTFHSAAMASHWVIPAAPGKADKLTAHAIDLPGKAISFELNETGDPKSIEWFVAGTEKHRWMHLTSLEFMPGQKMTITLDNAGYDVTIDNDGPATSAQLQIQSAPGAVPVNVGEIKIPAGRTQFQFERPETTLTLSNEIYGHESWLTAPVTISLDALDYSGKGIDYIEYSQDQSQWTTYSGPFIYASEGETTLYYRAKDKNAKLENTRHQAFKIDLQEPVIELSTEKSTYTRVELLNVEAMAIDPAPGSGLVRFEATFDGQPVVNGPKIDLLWLDLGTHLLEAQAEDLAGWMSHQTVHIELVANHDSLEELIERLYQLGEIDDQGIRNSLLSKAHNAQKSVQKGNVEAARHQLTAFIHEVMAQSGKHISTRAAQLLLADVNFVLDQL